MKSHPRVHERIMVKCLVLSHNTGNNMVESCITHKFWAVIQICWIVLTNARPKKSCCNKDTYGCHCHNEDSFKNPTLISNLMTKPQYGWGAAYFHILPLLWRNFIRYFDRVMFKLLKRAPSSPPTAPISMKMIR